MTECPVCLDAACEVLCRLQPCGHAVCVKCERVMVKARRAYNCVLCRAVVQGIVFEGPHQILIREPRDDRKLVLFPVSFRESSVADVMFMVRVMFSLPTQPFNLRFRKHMDTDKHLRDYPISQCSEVELKLK